MVNKEIKSIGIFSTTYNRRIEEIALQCCEIIINKEVPESNFILIGVGNYTKENKKVCEGK